MNIERIEALVSSHYTEWVGDKGASWVDHMRNALTEQAETHAIELRAYEATVANLEQRIRQLEAERVPDGWNKNAYGYSVLFNAIAASVTKNTDGSLGISVESFEDSMLAAAPAQEKV